MAQTKRIKAIKAAVEPGKSYSFDDAIQIIKTATKAKFVESVDVAVRLGVDAKKSDQQVRGSAVLPQGTGKTVRVGVFARGAKADEAREAGIEHFVFVTGRNKAVIEDHFDMGYELEDTLARRNKTRELEALKAFWLVEAAERLTDPLEVGTHDEQFHAVLVAAAGNAEMARVHWDVTERIRIIRRLDFTREDRIQATYDEHAKILRAVMQRKLDPAQWMLKSHIEQSKTEVRKITLHTLHEARGRLAARA